MRTCSTRIVHCHLCLGVGHCAIWPGTSNTKRNMFRDDNNNKKRLWRRTSRASFEFYANICAHGLNMFSPIPLSHSTQPRIHSFDANLISAQNRSPEKCLSMHHLYERNYTRYSFVYNEATHTRPLNTYLSAGIYTFNTHTLAPKTNAKPLLFVVSHKIES